MPDHRSIPKQKERLRKTARLMRDTLSHEGILDWSTQAIDRLQRLPKFTAAKTVFTYVSVKSEVRTRDMIERLWERSVHVLVPSMIGGQLGMLQINDWSDIRVDSLGRCTPLADATVFTGQPDINLVPGLAFTESGDRIGSGYGHYDRFIQRYPKTIHIGLAYELQVRQSLPIEPHDQRLDYLVTQDRVITTKLNTKAEG